MKLKYRILWIENEEDWVASIEDEIQEYLEELEFSYERKLIGKEEDGIEYNAYDLILMDLNLADQPNGAELIQRIRSFGVYTDVVFYSAMTDDLRAQGKEKELEGVYYTGRTPNTAFIKKVKKVIDVTIKKVQDLDNVRGLVMAEVSELDARMLSLINAYFVEKETEEKTSKFKKHLVDDVEKSTKKKLSQSEKCDKLCKHKWNDMAIADIVRDFEFDASRKARALKIIIETMGVPYVAENGNFYEDYRIDIIDMRNQLAHCVSEEKDGKDVLFFKNMEIIYDEAKFREIRRKIKTYNILFDQIEEAIK